MNQLDNVKEADHQYDEKNLTKSVNINRRNNISRCQSYTK